MRRRATCGASWSAWASRRATSRPAVESVEVRPAPGGVSLDVTFEAPERVSAYMDAVSAGDFERAELVMSAREG
jgi:hypothetical protein